METRAYSTFAVKSLDDEQRSFTGLATSPVPDRIEDVIETAGCGFKNPLVLLRAHDHTMPIGTVHFDRPTKSGIAFRASIPTITEPGLLKDRLDMSWGEIRHGLIRAVSVGFRPLEFERLPSGGVRYTKTEIYELSTVAVPAQELATIDAVKALDARVRAGEAPQVGSSDGTLWDRLARIGRATLHDVEAAASFKELGRHGPQVSGVRSVQEMVKALSGYVEDLERRVTENPLEYRGAWQAGQTYPARTFITFGGSVWYTGKATSRRPGEGVDWVLAVRKGQDAK